MPETALSALVDVLSRPVHVPKPDQAASLVIAEPPTPFVAPRFETEDGEGGSLEKEIILIEASAAAGKSTLASQLSATLKIPVLDLARVSVAAGSLHALLAGLEAADKSDPMAAFHEGRLPIIVDALDEGRLLSNEAGIEQFLGSSAELLQSDRRVTSRPKLVMLGRFESIELARQQFERAAPEVKHVTANVEFYDKEGARQLIHAYARAAARPGSHYLNHPDLAEDFITTFFDAIEAALGLSAGELWDDGRGKVFAGYAPLLAAVGSILAVIDDFDNVAKNLRANRGREAWGVVEAVLYEILCREQDKLRDRLSDQCESAVPNSVYDIEEQLTLLAQYIQSKPLEGAGRVRLSASDMGKYRAMVQTYLPHHPFLRRHEFGDAVLGANAVSRAVYHGGTISRDRLISLSRQWRQSGPTRGRSR
ncbi:hypothetical protein NWI01_32480 [Nitrobacter winogradskyi]|uniref:Uncharacterized protein n=1 Tax=Nitrobacter winogradskyi TaxID=913 RepID=A0A4Y3WJ23_NITWI|nr:hypothetical protein NWI01_32480 [Nitrobacter winogradskyi]